jgi:hypothetical protein
MEVSGQLHAPAVLPPGKSPRYPMMMMMSLFECESQNEKELFLIMCDLTAVIELILQGCIQKFPD